MKYAKMIVNKPIKVFSSDVANMEDEAICVIENINNN